MFNMLIRIFYEQKFLVPINNKLDIIVPVLLILVLMYLMSLKLYTK